MGGEEFTRVIVHPLMTHGKIEGSYRVDRPVLLSRGRRRVRGTGRHVVRSQVLHKCKVGVEMGRRKSIRRRGSSLSPKVRSSIFNPDTNRIKFPSLANTKVNSFGSHVFVSRYRKT